jgi:superfamily II DNA or RNA helicase
MIELRDYQKDVIDRVRDSLRVHDSVVAVLATGSGKTFCFSFMAKQSSENGRSVMIVAHRAELISQASMSLAAIGVEHQIIGPKTLERKIKHLHLEYYGKIWINPFSSIYVGSLQTIVKRLDKLPCPDLLVIDEGHHLPAGMWRKTKEHFNSKTIAFTATPCRSDGVGMGRVCTDMIIGKLMKPLINYGNLSKYIVYSTPEDINFDEVKRIKSGESKGDFNTRDLEKQVDKPKIVGRAVEHYKKYAEGKSCLVFGVSIKHSEHIAEEFRQAGYKFIAVSGNTEDSDRYKAVEDLKSKRIDGIVNCDLFGEGTDISGVEVVIMMRPISEDAFGLFSQQVGRALRIFPGKDQAIILDMVGNFQRHGFPEDKEDWTLDDREKKKRGASENVVKSKTCTECFHTHPPMPSCPLCGHVYPVEGAREYEQVDGDLVALQRQEAIQFTKAEQNAAIRNAKSDADLYAADRELGLGRGATKHKQQAIAEKKESIARRNRALKYWKETILWGDMQLHDKLFPELFGVTEAELRGFGAVRTNRVLDKMKKYVLELQKRAGGEYSPYEFDFQALAGEVTQ